MFGRGALAYQRRRNQVFGGFDLQDGLGWEVKSDELIVKSEKYGCSTGFEIRYYFFLLITRLSAGYFALILSRISSHQLNSIRFSASVSMASLWMMV